MVKRKCPDSGHLSHSRSKRRDMEEKRLRRVRRRNHINKRNFPDSSCSSPISGRTIGPRNHNSQSRSHDTQVTNSKNKANSKDYEDGIAVSRVTEETQSHGHKSCQRYKRKRKTRSLGTETSDSCSRISDLVPVTHGHDNTICLRNGSSPPPEVTNRKVQRSGSRKRKTRSLGTETSDSCSRISDLVSDTHGCDNTICLRNGSSSLPKVANRKVRRSRQRKRKSRDFQKENEAVQNEISANLCGEESRLDIKDGVATRGTEALNCENTHADALTGQEKADAPSAVTNNQDESVNLAAILTAEKILSTSRKKLLVLDLNGLLADIVLYRGRAHKSYTRVGEYLVLKRPFCEDFLKFCFERFNVGVWSSRMRKNVDAVVNYLMRNWKHKLLFCWDKSKCTDTGYRTIENRMKPLVLKELRRLWNDEHGLPWEKGEYSPSNTLLVDDSPYKAICNPPHSAIFPPSFNAMDKNDNSLGPGGDLRVYLKRLVMADNVQLYVQDHPFGQSAITESDPSWKFYLRIIKKFQKPSSVTT